MGAWAWCLAAWISVAGIGQLIVTELQAVESWWCDPSLGDRAFEPHQVTPLSTRRDVEDALHSTGLRTLRPSDVAVIYVTGHGRRGASGRHYLLLPDTARDRLPATGYPTSDLITAVLDSHAEHVLVIIDSCSAGTLIAEFAQLRENFNPSRRDLTSLNVFTIGDFDEKPRVREFDELLTQLGKQWWTRAGYADPFLTVDEFTYPGALAGSSLAHVSADLITSMVSGQRKSDLQPPIKKKSPQFTPEDSIIVDLSSRRSR